MRVCPPKKWVFVPNKEISLVYNEMITKRKIVGLGLDKCCRGYRLVLQGEIHRRRKEQEMNYEDKINIRLAKIEAERERLLLDLDLLYKRGGQGWATCKASDSGLVELACWCAECKELSAMFRKIAKRQSEMGL